MANTPRRGGPDMVTLQGPQQCDVCGCMADARRRVVVPTRLSVKACMRCVDAIAQDIDQRVRAQPST
jgi:hypothetical protein